MGVPMLSAQEVSDQQYVRGLLQPGQSTSLDLSDPVQQRFLETQLRLAGHSPATSPALFAYKDQLQQLPSAAGATAGTTLTGTWDPMNTIVSADSNGSYCASTGLSSIPGGTLATMMTVQLFDHATGQPLGTNTITQYNQGQYLTLGAKGTAPTSGEAYALLTVLYVPKSGQSIPPQTMVLDITVNPVQPPAVTAPVHIKTTSPNPIMVGLNRTPAQQRDLDYWYYPGWQSGQPLAVVQVSGNCTWPQNIVTNAQGKLVYGENLIAILGVVNNNAGGGGAFYPVSNIASIGDYLTVTGSKLTWNFVPALFGAAPWQTGQKIDLTLTLGVHLANDPTHWVTCMVTSTAPASANTTHIDQLSFVWSCVAEGTEVTLADGSRQKIETVNTQQALRSDAGDGRRFVRDVMRRTDNTRLLELRTKAGHVLSITHDHPVITPKGEQLAEQLQPGDLVCTEDGTAEIVTVTEQPYAGATWNFNLVRDLAQLVRDVEQDGTFFANGILIGDFQMQSRHHSLTDHGDPDRIMAELPAEWLADFQNHLAEVKAGRRNEG